MNLYLLISMVAAFLEREGRISQRTLREGLGIDEARFAALLEELTRTKPIHLSEFGVLEWQAVRNDLITAPSTAAGATETTEATEAGRRQLTVMFCDLVGSTALSTELDPEDLRDVMAAFQDRCRTAIQRYDGFIARYMGDGVLVYFGYPRAHEDDAERAIRAGLDLLESMPELNQTLAGRVSATLAVRCGVATGPVIVGDIIGEGAAEEAVVVGETPNLAARLQGVADLDQLVIGPQTRSLAGERFVFEDAGLHRLKGIPAPVQVWRVLGEAEASTDEHSSLFDLPLVGRQEELGLLLRGWEAASEGNGQVALIQGEAGVGKSRLLDALREKVRDDNPLWVAIRCSPYHTNSPSYPLIRHLRQALGWLPEDDDCDRLRKLETTLRRQSQLLADIVPLLAGLLSLSLPQEQYPALNLEPRQLRELTQDAVVGWLMDEAEARPVLQVWEDMHWADPTTIELLELFIDQSPTASILNVVTYRPEFVPTWRNRSHITPITLNRLEKPEVQALISNVTHGKSFPQEVMAHVIEKADGVPLFAEELTRTILEQEILEEEGERFVLRGSLSDLEIPATLQDSLMARLDRVPAVREVAQIGAVLGREFGYDMVSALVAMGDVDLRAGLAQLVENEVLYQRGRPPRATYIFKHALIRDAAYHSLLNRTRARFHLQIGQLLDAHFPEIVQANPELLAHHYTAAGDAEKPVHYWRRAGQMALERSAGTEAVHHFGQAIELAGTRPESNPSELLALQLPLAAAYSMQLGLGAAETGGRIYPRERTLRTNRSCAGARSGAVRPLALLRGKAGFPDLPGPRKRAASA